MVQRDRQSWAFFFALLVAVGLCCLAAGDGAGAKSLRRVLIVYENESTLPAAMEIAQGLRRRLEERSPAGLELYAEYLDTVRFPDPQRVGQLVAGLATKYRTTQPDVIIAVGPSVLSFLVDHRGELGMDAPIVFGALDETELKERPPPPDMSGVFSYFDIPKTIELATRLQPDARRIVVVTGSSNFDRSWEMTARDVLPKTTALQAEFWTGETLEDFKQRARGLGPSDILLILSIFKDADGTNFVPREAMAQIAAVAGAPSYSIYSTYVGFGVVGGYVEPFQSVGENLAELAHKVVEDPGVLPQIVRSSGEFLVDAREMKRWGLDFARLPEGSVLQFYEPSAWERYRPQIVIALGVIAAQAVTIAALIIQGRRRRRAEQDLTLERLELAHLSRTTQLGELSGAFAHELNQPLTSILANAEAGARLVQKDNPDVTEVAAILEDIIKEDKRAADVIQQLRQLMVKGETKRQTVNLNEAVSATIALASSELIARQTSASFRRDGSDLRVRGNFAQLQQIILNLMLNATEAMGHLQPAERQIDIETRRRPDGYCEIAITDRGSGIPPDMRSSIFKPFVSTKSKGLGLGLAICRTIAAAHEGTLEFEVERQVGARFILALPSA
jgi:signal transduction histidine kinase